MLPNGLFALNIPLPRFFFTSPFMMGVNCLVVERIWDRDEMKKWCFIKESATGKSAFICA